MTPESLSIIATAIALAGLILNGQRLQRQAEHDIRRELGDLRERMAKLEGLLEGLREAISDRGAA